jgi:hypothetical protein
MTTTATPTPQTVATGIIDGDGYIRERDEDLYPYFGRSVAEGYVSTTVLCP